MKCKVLIAGRYNDRLDQAYDYAVGDILETGTAYGEILIAKGYVEQVDEPIGPETVEEKAEEKPAAPARRRRPNAFTPQE